MDKEIVDFSDSQLRKAFTLIGLNAEDVDRAISDYVRYRESELSSLSLLSSKELESLNLESLNLRGLGLKDGREIIKDIYIDYFRYLGYKIKIAKTYKESKDWLAVFCTDVYSDVYEAQEAFIDYLEETYQTKIKDAKHLQELTGITQLNRWDNKELKYVDPETEEEANNNAIEQLEDTLMGSRYSKYNRALEKAFKEGVKYKELLQITPQEFGLPNSWGTDRSRMDQYRSILIALYCESHIGEGLMFTPDLRSIAKEIEAPYSVLMDAHKYFD